MTIEWFDVDNIPVPLVDCIIQRELHDFMYHLGKTPTIRGSRREKTSLDTIKWHLKIWFDYLEDHGLYWRNVTYKEHLEPLRDYLIDERISNLTYNQYYTSWRMFYEWCSGEGIATLMEFPALIELDTPKSSKDDDMLAHSKQHKAKIKKDPGHEQVTKKTDFAESFVSIEKFITLVAALHDIDPVYAAIAYMMYGTGLRIGGVVQVPIGPCKLNPNWMLWAELKHEGLADQDLTYVPKGKKGHKKCMVPTHIMKLVHDTYIKPFYEERAQIYASKRQYGGGKRPPSNLLWLNKNGKIIFANDIQKAFKIASKKIGFKVKPHFMRHSFATYVVLNYFKSIEMEPNSAFASDVHFAVKEQLGHSKITTTELYINTVNRVKAKVWLPKLTPLQESKIDKNISTEVRETILKIFGME